MYIAQGAERVLRLRICKNPLFRDFIAADRFIAGKSNKLRCVWGNDSFVNKLKFSRFVNLLLCNACKALQFFASATPVKGIITVFFRSNYNISAGTAPFVTAEFILKADIRRFVRK